MNQEQPQNHNQSDVARLLMTIDLEYRAAWNGLSGLNQGTATHEFINHRMEKIGLAAEELKQLVGEKEAARIVVEQMDKATDRREN